MTTSNERPQQKDPLIGTVFAGRYMVESRLGRGGMGVVYKASQTNANRKVVLKVLAPDWIGDPEALARFEREARGLSALQHPNIVAIHDYGSFDGRAYIVMEYVAGETLERFVKRKGRLTVADFVPIAAQVLKGLGEAHSRGIIHRDIKPANLMLCERQGRANYVKILDFGLAKLVSGSSDITKQNVLGTPTCLSPEQIKGEKLDQRVDVYAVGILFYYMLAGVMPFAAENDASILYKHVHEEPAPLADQLPEGHQVPEGVVDLIERCLKKSPSKRPRDANEVVEGLIDQVPFSMFKLPRAESKPPGFEAQLDEPYADSSTGEHTGEAIPGPQDIHVGTFGRTDPSGSMATPATSGTSQSLVAAAAAAAAAAQAGSSTGSHGANPLAAQPPTGSHPTGPHPTGPHPTMGNPMMSPMATTYPPGAFPPIDSQPDRSRNGILILGFVTLGVIAVLGYFALTNRGDVQQDTPKVADDSQARLQSLITRAEKNIDRKQYSQAQILLDSSIDDFARYPDLMEQVAAQKDRIEIGRLLDSGRNYEEAGQKGEALKAYREILNRRSDHVEARERIAALMGGSADAALGWLTASSSPVGGVVYLDGQETPLGLTPLTAQPIAAGPHQISIRLEGFLPWKKSVTIEANKTFPINAELTPKRGIRKPPRPTKPASKPDPVKPKQPATKKKKKATKPTKPPTKKKNNGLLPMGH